MRGTSTAWSPAVSALLWAGIHRLYQRQWALGSYDADF